MSLVCFDIDDNIRFVVLQFCTYTFSCSRSPGFTVLAAFIFER